MKSIQQKHLTSKHFDSFVSIFFLFFLVQESGEKTYEKTNYIPLSN